MTAEELKHALMNYNHIMNWWETNDDRVQCIIYEMEGVKGIRYDKELSKDDSPINIDEKMLSYIALKDELIISSKHYEKTINTVHEFIDWLEEPYKQMAIDKYLYEMSDTKLEHKYNYSARGIRYIMDGMVCKFIKSFP